MAYAENEEPETCIICGGSLTYFKATGWTCRVCDE